MHFAAGVQRADGSMGLAQGHTAWLLPCQARGKVTVCQDPFLWLKESTILFFQGSRQDFVTEFSTESSILFSLITSDSRQYPSINRERMASLCPYNQDPIYTKTYQITIGSKCVQLSQRKRTGVFLVTYKKKIPKGNWVRISGFVF